jgi:hypothetical protein
MNWDYCHIKHEWIGLKIQIMLTVRYGLDLYTGHTQKNGAVLIVFTIKTATFFCVCPV